MIRNRFWEPEEEPSVYELVSWELCGRAKADQRPVSSRASARKLRLPAKSRKGR